MHHKIVPTVSWFEVSIHDFHGIFHVTTKKKDLKEEIIQNSKHFMAQSGNSFSSCFVSPAISMNPVLSIYQHLVEQQHNYLNLFALKKTEQLPKKCLVHISTREKKKNRLKKFSMKRNQLVFKTKQLNVV